MSDERQAQHQAWLEKESLHERPIVVHIKQVATGETRPIADSGLFSNLDGEFQEFIWSEGNYACDCNRALLFHDDDGDYSCGDEAYEVHITDEHGQEIYRDGQGDA